MLWGGPRLLHVEDHEGVRRSLRRLLGDFGEVVEAETVEQSRALIDEAELIDLVLLDLLLPDEPGVTLLEHLRGRRPCVPVVVISGADVEVLDEMLRPFTVTVHRKPVSPHELRLGIARLAPQRFAAAIEHFITQAPLSRRRAELLRRMARGAHGCLLASELGVAQKMLQSMRSDFRLACGLLPEQVVAAMRQAYPWP